MIYVEIQFDLISRDALTGLNNRRAFDSQLEKISEYGLTESDGKAYHIFMMDINLFKEINDTYGHIEGDNALVVVAKIISKHFENTNAFKCRYGGDEFAVIYWCTSDEAGKILKEIYSDFENSSQSYNLEYKLSVSIGYATINGRGLESAKKALKLADSNLYVEKDFMHKKLNR
ncbi:MAG: GGDEF domain-containing protein [Treponema sp.]|nr:GGDEF domain-containing protein [Treponema sp.]